MRTKLGFAVTPPQMKDMKGAFISNSGSFDTRLMVKYAQVFKTKMVSLKP